MTYQVGDSVIIGNHTATGAAAFTVLSGTATDPTTATLVLGRPDGSVLQYGWPTPGTDGTLAKEATGRLYQLVVMDQGGVWEWYLAGDGAVKAAAQGRFYVEPLNVTIP